MQNRKKIRVLQITGGLSPEGIGTFVLNTYENIDKGKINVSFALATKWKQRYEQKILDQGDKVFRTSEIGEGIFGKIKHFINLIKLLRKEGPFDVVHSHMDFFNGINMLAAFVAGVPIRISHGHKGVNKQFLSPGKKIYNASMKVLINTFASHKLACSEKINEYMHDMKWKKNKSKVLLNGINLSRFSSDRTYDRAPQDIKTSTGKINFITIGRMDDPKNPLFTVKIINHLKKINKDIHLYWVGIGSLEKEVKELVNKYELNDTISFLGVRDDVAELLKSMDYMLLPSKWEGLPMVLIETQASGVPCFISNIITKEIDAGLCTYLSLSEDEIAWANKIDEYIRHKTYNKKVNLEKLRKFDIRTTVKELESIYAGG